LTTVRLALLSLRNRWLTAVLAVLAIAVSVMLLLGVEKVRVGARASFANTIASTDLIVGARTGGIQLLLYTVFRIGDATNNISWRSYQAVAARPEAAWSVPLSLGDSHRGFRVLGTSTDYFTRYRYRRDQSLEFQAGAPFADLFDTVLGADVAGTLGYRLGDPIVVAHGLGEIETSLHDDKPFRVAGILRKTGTPVDRTVHVSLEAIEAIHIDWQGGRRDPSQAMSAAEVAQLPLQPRAITAALVGLTSRLGVFRLQRFINEFRDEPLTAILPGVALQQLWSLVATAETALLAVSAMVVVTAILGMVTMVLATLNERRREVAILRAVGAGPRTIVALMVSEAVILTTAGVLAGIGAVYVGLLLARGPVDAAYGIYLEIGPPTATELQALAAIIVAGALAGLLPAWRAYRLSLADGMTVRT